MCANKLKLNLSKTKILIFNNKTKNRQPISIYINNTKIEQTNSAKLLGIDIDNNLNFKLHISKVSAKMAYCGHVISQLAGTVSYKILKSIYFAFANSLLEYGITIWGSANKNALNPVKVMQNSIIRKLYPHFHRPRTEQIYNNLHILKVENLYKFKICNHMHRIIHNPPTKELYNKICNKKFNYYAIRNENYYTKPQFTLKKATNCISWQCPTQYNLLPNRIKNISQLSAFKKELKNYLFS